MLVSLSSGAVAAAVSRVSSSTSGPATRPSFSTNTARREGPTCSRRRRTMSSMASAKAARARPAQHRVARERAEEHAANVVGHARRRAVDRRDVRVANPHQDVELFAAAEERPQDEHLGQNDARGEEVAARVELAADDLLRRHVAQLAFELTGVGASLDLRRAGDAEVGELHRARPIDEHVAGRHVAMHERQRAALVVARAMGVVEGAKHRERDVQANVEGHVFAACAAARMSRAAVVPSTYSIAM